MTPSFIVQLAALGAHAPSADNCQPWRLRWTGAALEITYAQRHAATNVFGALDHATLLSVGAVAENIQAGLAANGLDGTWRWQAAPEGSYGALAIANPPADYIQAEAAVQRHTNRLPFARTPLPAGEGARLAAEAEGGNRALLIDDAARKAQLVALVRRCSEARFCNHALHEWLFNSLRHTPAAVARGDGLDVATLGLPPGGKAMLGFMADWKRMAMLNRLGAYKLLARAEIGLIAAAPGLVCIVGPGDTQGVIDAGRLLARVWTGLNARGIAVQPFYVVSDQINRLHAGTLAAGFAPAIAAAEAELRSLLALAPGQMLHMMLRVGHPRATPVRARRLAPAEVFVDASGTPAS